MRFLCVHFASTQKDRLIGEKWIPFFVIKCYQLFKLNVDRCFFNRIWRCYLVILFQLISLNNFYHLTLAPVMANGIRTGDRCRFNKGRSSKFRERSWVRQTPEEGRRTYRPKRCGNNNKDEVNSPKTLNDKNHQASSKKFRQLISLNKWFNIEFFVHRLC